MRFVSQLMRFPGGARSQSEAPAGRRADAMGDGKGAAGSGAGGRHPRPATLLGPPEMGFPAGQTPSRGHRRGRRRAAPSCHAEACTGEALAEDSGETWG